MVELIFIGYVFVIKFPRTKELINDLTDIMRMSNCEIEPHTLSELSGFISYRVTAFEKKSTAVAVIKNIKDYIKTHKEENTHPVLTIRHIGRKYQTKLAKKLVRKLHSKIKHHGCRVAKLTVDEGDGCVNISITVPQGKVKVTKADINKFIKDFAA